MQSYAIPRQRSEKLEAAATEAQHADGTGMFKIKEGGSCHIITTEPPVTASYNPSNKPPVWSDFFEADTLAADDQGE